MKNKKKVPFFTFYVTHIVYATYPTLGHLLEQPLHAKKQNGAFEELRNSQPIHGQISLLKA